LKDPVVEEVVTVEVSLMYEFVVEPVVEATSPVDEELEVMIEDVEDVDVVDDVDVKSVVEELVVVIGIFAGKNEKKMRT
jgi:hypothetical protein